MGKELKEFKKLDSGKVRFDLLYGPFIEGMAAVMTFGAKKYDDDNWHKCGSMRRYFSALMRHMWAWWFKGEDIDPESGLHHAFHAGCSLMMLFGLQDMFPSTTDDRPEIIHE